MINVIAICLRSEYDRAILSSSGDQYLYLPLIYVSAPECRVRLNILSPTVSLRAPVLGPLQLMISYNVFTMQKSVASKQHQDEYC